MAEPPLPDFLAAMAQSSHARDAAARERCSITQMRARAEKAPPPPQLELSAEGFDLIAELKRRSPAAGGLAQPALSPAAQATAYVDGGAAALSVLTEPDRFDGSLADLSAVAEVARTVPAMRKDFIVSDYQLYEARAAGAGGILLIAAMHEPEALRELIQASLALGLFVLVEFFDRQDIDACGQVVEDCAASLQSASTMLLAGLNCRNLRTLQVDFARFAELAPHLPQHCVKVAESGVETVAQAREVAGLGYRLALVGTALMRSGDPAGMTRSLIAAGRGAA